MTNLLNILVISFGATTLMTSFSYMASFLANRNFREPQLLNMVLNNSRFFPFSVKKKSIVGWILHYLIGILFTFSAFIILFFTDWAADNSFGILFGAAAGITGIIWWSITLKNFDQIIPHSRNSFYVQLLIAHVLFGLGISLFSTLFYQAS